MTTVMLHTRPIGTFLAIGLMLFFAACSSSRGTTGTGEEPVELPASETVQLSEYEDFDPAPYRDEPPPQELAFQHDVPAALMEDRADRGLVETIDGYRIQVLSTQDKAAADKEWAEAIAWWQEETEAGNAPTVFPEELPVYVVFRQPYYRVRLGDFPSRNEAQDALNAVTRHFPGAFIVPDKVTVTR